MDKEQIMSNSLDLANKTIIISSGGTREYIDPVRFIGNRSSGEMGFALAQEALYRGATVILVTTVDYEKDPIKSAVLEHQNLVLLKVNTSDEMRKTIETNFNDSVDILIMSAAVADYKPKTYSENKIKKKKDEDNATINLELTENIDIVKHVASQKLPEQIIVGFSLETENLIENARKKLIDKNLDMIVANNQEALGNYQSQISIIYPRTDKTQGLKIFELELQDKIENARSVLDHLNLILKARNEKNPDIISG